MYFLIQLVLRKIVHAKEDNEIITNWLGNVILIQDNFGFLLEFWMCFSLLCLFHTNVATSFTLEQTNHRLFCNK